MNFRYEIVFRIYKFLVPNQISNPALLSPKLTNLLIEFKNKIPPLHPKSYNILQTHNPWPKREPSCDRVRPWITRSACGRRPPWVQICPHDLRPRLDSPPILTLSPWTQFSTVYVCERTACTRPHFPLRRSLSSPCTHWSTFLRATATVACMLRPVATPRSSTAQYDLDLPEKVYLSLPKIVF